MKILINKTTLLIIIILIPKIIYASFSSEYIEPLSQDEIILQSIFIFAVCVDWKQTKIFRSKGIEELNPILGKTPSPQKVDNMILLAIISHTSVMLILPEEVREFWILPFIYFEIDAIQNNWQLSGNLNFKF